VENVNVPGAQGGDNPFVTQYLKSSDAKKLVARQGNRLASIYRASVHKRTGRLAASTTVTVVMGGRKADRWEAHVTVTAPYAASHEFGTEFDAFVARSASTPSAHPRRERDLRAYHELWDSLKAMDWS